MICPDNNNSQQCKSQWVEELSICNKTITANKWPKSSLRGLRFQIQSEDLCELHACLGFPCTSEVSDSWMTRNERVNIYGTKVYSACKRWLLWARTVSSNLCEVNCSSVSFKCVIQVCHYPPRAKIPFPHTLLCSCRFPSEVRKLNKQVRLFSHWDLIGSMWEKMWDGFLSHDVRHFSGLLCSVIDEKQLPSESDLGLSFSDYSLEAHLRAKNFPVWSCLW